MVRWADYDGTRVAAPGGLIFKIANTNLRRGWRIIVKVEGTDGVYQLDITLTPAEGDDV